MEINGLKVVDTTKKLTLRITARDVKLGANSDPGACAAARCLLRSFKRVKDARVHIGRTYVRLGNKYVRFHTPQSLRTEIVSFDRNGTFSPGEYVLTPMQPSHRATGKRHGTAKRKGGKKRPYHKVYGVRQFGANR